MSEKISIIIPVYNAERYLDKCIESLVNQTYKNLEIILIDDKSTDNSLLMCKKWRDKDKRIIIIEKGKNEGQAVARNNGLDRSTGDLVTFVDSDDWIDLGLIEKLYKSLEVSQIDVSCCGFRLMYESGNSREIRRKNMEIDSQTAFGSMLNNHGSEIGNEVCGKLFRRKILEKKRFVEGMLYEDAQMMLQVLREDIKIVCIEECLYNYFIRDNSTMRKSFGVHELDRLKVWNFALSIAEDKYNQFIEQAKIRVLRCEIYLYYKFLMSRGCNLDKQLWIEMKKKIRENKLKKIKKLADFREKIVFLCIKFRFTWYEKLLVKKEKK